ncbi:MAG: patatin-like phospholipase family protein [Thiotrichales bacterium]|nr:patatin-like phospholipase family protein [Thiotrichales bacterium]
MTDFSHPNIHLVLGSGGARGLAHIGVIHYLQAQGFSITQITGCSMGALIGGIYAAGKLEEYETWVRQIRRLDVLRFLDLSLDSRKGFVKGDKIMEQLRQWVGHQAIEQLPIPFSAVSTDILAQKEVWISQGDLVDAIRASISVPGIFTPLVTQGRVLVDGGILNPLPVPPASIEARQITVAVSLSGRAVQHPLGDAAASDIDSALADDQNSPITRFVQGLQQWFAAETPEPNSQPNPLSLSDIMIGMFNTMQDTLTRYQLAGNPPDILIEIPVNICQSHEFHLANRLIPAGAYWAEKAMTEQLAFVTHANGN